MPFYDLTCSEKHEQLDVFLKLGERPPCPICGNATETLWRSASTPIGDEIPGGIEIRNGLCNEDNTPRRYYSHSEIRAEAKRRGLTNYVVHKSPQGTDKSKETTRWT